MARQLQQDPSLASLGTVTGPWAAACTTGRDGDTLLAVDPLGIMPLFWTRTSTGSILAASWLAALVDRPDVDDRLDLEGLLLDRGWEFHDRSILHRTHFATVSRVPGGCFVRIRPDGSTRLERYWDVAQLPGPDTSLSLADCAELMRASLEGAIRRAASPDRRIGAHISGGLDSTAIACRANQVLHESGRELVAGYSWAPPYSALPQAPGDERGLIDQVQAAEGFGIRMVDPAYDPDDWYRELDPTRYPDSTHFRERFVLPRARADGVEVLLSGWGGDEAASYNGFGGMRGLLRGGRVPTMLREASLRAAVTSPGGLSTRRRLRRMPASLLSPVPAPLQWARHPRVAWESHRRWKAANRRIARFSPLAASIQRSARDEVDSLTDIHERMVAFLQRGHLQHRTGWWYQTGRLMGIDYRYPLLDLDVVAVALRMPWWAFMSHGWDRPAFRLAIEPWVPSSVAWNVTKDEPALLGRMHSTPSLALRRPPHPPAGFDVVTELAELSWYMDGPPVRPDSPPAHRALWARPDLAPRIG